MTNVEYTVRVSKDIEDLIPTFLSNRRNEVKTLRAALEWENFEHLTYLGNRMRGCGTPYGFDRVSVLGQCIFDAAQVKDSALLADKIVEYATYLSCVQVSIAD